MQVYPGWSHPETGDGSASESSKSTAQGTTGRVALARQGLGYSRTSAPEAGRAHPNSNQVPVKSPQEGCGGSLGNLGCPV